MRTFIRLLAGLIVSAALSACASTSVYAPRSSPGGAGYSEQRIDESHWRVEFVGDENASAAIVERALLYRAAELTQASGYDWFKPSDHSADSETEIIVEAQRPMPSAGFGSNWRPYWRRHGLLGWSDWRPRGPDPYDWPTPPASSGWLIVRYNARETIEMGHGAKPLNGFDASAVTTLLAPEIEPAR